MRRLKSFNVSRRRGGGRIDEGAARFIGRVKGRHTGVLSDGRLGQSITEADQNRT